MHYQTELLQLTSLDPRLQLDDDDKRNTLVSGDYYFYNFLNSKVKLTAIGLQILESIKEKKQSNANIPN